MSTEEAFISYSWDSDEHKDWVRDLAAKLRVHGVAVTLDRWALEHGDLLPKFMETSIREHKRVLIVCTPKYKAKADGREGGVGYEGNVMTGEVFAGEDPRKFIPVLRSGSWKDSSPSWMAGKYGVDLRGDPYDQKQFEDLLDTLRGTREQAPPVGVRTTGMSGTSPRQNSSPQLSSEAITIVRAAAGSDGNILAWEHDAGFAVIIGEKTFGEPGNVRSQAAFRDGVQRLVSAGMATWNSQATLKLTLNGFKYVDSINSREVVNFPAHTSTSHQLSWEPIKITGIIANEVGSPRNDGTRGSALYAVPFQLSRRPSPEWAEHFVQTWNRPPTWSTMHRPGIARVEADRVILDGTTVEEVAKAHRDTLLGVVAKVNQDIGEWEQRMRRESEAAAERQRQHKKAVANTVKMISFD